MSSLEDVDFLGFPCEVHGDIFKFESTFVVTNPYKCTYILGHGIDPKAVSPQIAVNCIKASIEWNKKGKVAFWLTKHEYEKRAEKFFENQVFCCYDDIVNMSVNHSKKPFNLLRFFGEKLESEGMFKQYVPTPEDFILNSIVIEPMNDQFVWWSHEGVEILNYLEKHCFIKQYRTITYGLNGHLMINSSPKSVSQKGDDISITIDGWAWLGEPENHLTNKVFIAMAFSAWKDEPDTLQAIQQAIKDACKDREFNLDYEANIVDQKHLENISNKIIAQIKESKFIIADFTYNNRGVYFEAGLALGGEKPVIHLVRDDCLNGKDEEGKKLHFDTAQINHLVWNTPEDIRRELPAWIKANIN